MKGQKEKRIKRKMLKILIAISLMLGPMFLTASRTTKENTLSKTYTVESGDSLYTIAKKFHTTVSALRKTNNLEEGALLHPGQKLLLPARTSGKNGPVTAKKQPLPKTKAPKKEKKMAPACRSTKSKPEIPSRPSPGRKEFRSKSF